MGCCKKPTKTGSGMQKRSFGNSIFGSVVHRSNGGDAVVYV